MLSSTEIESYHQDGFVIPDFRIDEETPVSYTHLTLPTNREV